MSYKAQNSWVRMSPQSSTHTVRQHTPIYQTLTPQVLCCHVFCLHVCAFQATGSMMCTSALQIQQALVSCRPCPLANLWSHCSYCLTTPAHIHPDPHSPRVFDCAVYRPFTPQKQFLPPSTDQCPRVSSGSQLCFQVQCLVVSAE